MKPMTPTASVLLLAVLTACSQTQVAETSPGLTAEDEAAIRALITQWDRNVVEDFPANADLYTDDYVEMRATAVEGREAARELYAGFTFDWTESVTTVREIEGRGDLAYLWTESATRYTNANGVAMLQNASNLWVLRKGADGQWRVARSGWQSASRPADG